MPEREERYSAAWPQFLVAKKEMLDAYDRARTHAREQIVATHHGVVGEAAVREWLADFLPKRYGVASGFIRSQGLPKPHQSRHFDVIIYDQLEAPTLWIEDNKDKSDSGRLRIIPAEFVQAILEVKSVFDRSTVRAAVAKLEELRPLMESVDRPGENYPRFLRASCVVAILFFEIRIGEEDDIDALKLLRDARFQRPFYGSIVLRGEGKHPDDTALIRTYQSELPFGQLLPPGDCLAAVSL